MTDFSHLQKLDTPLAKTVKYPLTDISPKWVLDVAPATEENKPFFNQLLRKSKKTNKAVQAGNLSVNLIEQNREEDRELYAKHIVKGWQGVTDAKGVKVEYNPTTCLELMQQLPKEIFDELRTFCSARSNFTDGESLDVEVTAKN